MATLASQFVGGGGGGGSSYQSTATAKGEIGGTGNTTVGGINTGGKATPAWVYGGALAIAAILAIAYLMRRK